MTSRSSPTRSRRRRCPRRSSPGSSTTPSPARCRPSRASPRSTGVGGVDREINVLVDPARLAAQGVTASQVNDALAQVNVDAPGGRVRIGGREQTLRVLGAALNVDQIRDLDHPDRRRPLRAALRRRRRGRRRGGDPRLRAAERPPGGRLRGLQDQGRQRGRHRGQRRPRPSRSIEKANPGVNITRRSSPGRPDPGQLLGHRAHPARRHAAGGAGGVAVPARLAGDGGHGGRHARLADPDLRLHAPGRLQPQHRHPARPDPGDRHPGRRRHRRDREHREARRHRHAALSGGDGGRRPDRPGGGGHHLLDHRGVPAGGLHARHPRQFFRSSASPSRWPCCSRWWSPAC